MSFTHTAASAAADLSLSDFSALLARRCRESGELAAFVENNTVCRWNELDVLSSSLVAELSAKGIGKGSRVGICVPNSLRWVYAFFAVQKLGAVAVPISPSLPGKAVELLAKYAGISLLFCDGADGSGIEGPDLFDLSGWSPSAAHCPAPTAHSAEDTAVLFFTSGTEGAPKGILLSAENLLRSILPLTEDYPVSCEDRICGFLPLFHVFGFCTCVLLSLLSGCTTVFPADAHPETLLDTIEKQRCTIFPTVPTMALAVARHSSFSPARAASLRLTVLGGAPVTPAQMEQLSGQYAASRLVTVYGMTEHPAISYTRPDDSPSLRSSTAGRPLEEVELALHEKTGEILLRSPRILGRRINGLPLSEPDGWFATGDLGELDPSGCLRIVGRRSGILIRGGENISPEVIAAALTEFHGVAEVQIIGVPHELLGEEIAAAVIPVPGVHPDWQAAALFLAERLERRTIPAYFVELESFPLLPGGKVDRAALKKIVLEHISRSSDV